MACHLLFIKPMLETLPATRCSTVCRWQIWATEHE